MSSQCDSFKRRTLQSLAALTGTALLPACVARDSVNRESDAWVPGLQLYTLGKAPANDLKETLRQVAAIGYRAVEFPEPYGQFAEFPEPYSRSARELRKALDDAGLECPSVHFTLETGPGVWGLLNDDLARTADGIKTIGASYVIVGSSLLPETAEEMIRDAWQQPQPDEAKIAAIYASQAADSWRETADLLNERGSILARSGLRIAYHNHDIEFLPVAQGKTGYDILLERTDPAIVDIQLDVGWVAAAGKDPVALLTALGRRVRLMHLKDFKRIETNPPRWVSTDLGTGVVDWDALIRVIRRLQVPHLYVEQEDFPISRMDSARADYRFLSEKFASIR